MKKRLILETIIILIFMSIGAVAGHFEGEASVWRGMFKNTISVDSPGDNLPKNIGVKK